MKKVFVLFLVMLFTLSTVAIAEADLGLQQVIGEEQITQEEHNQAIIDILSNGNRLYPSGTTLTYLPEAMTELDDCMFEDGEESKALIGTVWLLTGIMSQDKFGPYVDIDGKKISILHVLNYDEPKGDYTMPEDGETANFILIYIGSKRGYALFQLGANEAGMEHVHEIYGK